MSNISASLSNHIKRTARFAYALLICAAMNFANHNAYADPILEPGAANDIIQGASPYIPGMNDISNIIGAPIPDLQNISGIITGTIGINTPTNIGDYGQITDTILSDLGVNLPDIPMTIPSTPSELISIFDSVAGTDIASEITTAATGIANDFLGSIPGLENVSLGTVTDVLQLGDAISNLPAFTDISGLFSDTIGNSLTDMTTTAITNAGNSLFSPITDAVTSIAGSAASTFGSAASTASTAFSDLSSATNSTLANIGDPLGGGGGGGGGLFSCGSPGSPPTLPPGASSGDLCTADSCGNTTPTFTLANTNIVSNIILKIKSKIYDIGFKLYNGILLDIGFLQAVNSALVLYVAIYGILFMTGMVPLKLYDFMIRMVKIGIIGTLMTPTSWLFFSNTVIKFFDGGTDDIINFTTSNAFGISLGALADLQIAGSPAFTALDAAFSKVVSAKMFVTLLATAVDPNYGPIMFLLMLAAIWSFIRSVLTALWVYIMSTVMKSLLFGLAPLFIPTILFTRTRYIFDGWLNQLINASLQPILLFMFFLFFIRLMEGSIDTILSNPICFSKFPDGWRGSSFEFFFWRFMEHTSSGYVPNLNDFKLSDGFAVSQVAILTFLLIAEIANRFNTVVITIAGQLAQASTSFHGVDNPLSSALSSAGHAARPGLKPGNPVGNITGYPGK